MKHEIMSTESGYHIVSTKTRHLPYFALEAMTNLQFITTTPGRGACPKQTANLVAIATSVLGPRFQRQSQDLLKGWLRGDRIMFKISATSVSTSPISISMSSASSPLTLGFLVGGKCGNLHKDIQMLHFYQDCSIL